MPNQVVWRGGTCCSTRVLWPRRPGCDSAGIRWLGFTSAVDNAHRSDLSSEFARTRGRKARIESPKARSADGKAHASVTAAVILLHPISARSSTPKRLSAGDRVWHKQVGSWGFSQMRLGIFGGTFDPIHLGHLVLADQCRESCALERVWFVVAGEPPHKRGELTAVAHRLEMVRIAVAGHPSFAVSDIEANRPGPHYSVETLESVSRERPHDELFFLIGADSLNDLPGGASPVASPNWLRLSW